MSGRCYYKNCNKRLKLTDYKCKCNNIYCSIHRIPETHDCDFDYKNSINKEKIIENMRCVSSKIEKF